MADDFSCRCHEIVRLIECDSHEALDVIGPFFTLRPGVAFRVEASGWGANVAEGLERIVAFFGGPDGPFPGEKRNSSVRRCVVSANAAELSSAAETYERLVAAGELKSESFRAAMASIGRNAKGRPVSALPIEVPGLIESVVRSQVTGDWRAVVREVTTGTSRHPVDTAMRAMVAYVLHRHGYHERTIGLAMDRDRSTILKGLLVFERRMAADEVLRARVERMCAAGKARAA